MTSEAYPLLKTGGLGDVAGSLPVALQALGCDVRILMPAYREALERAGAWRRVAALTLPGVDAPVALLETTLPGSPVAIWLLDHAPAYDRPGNPYLAPDGTPWSDNAQRYALLGRAAAAVGLGTAGLAWQPDIVHGNDWQSGLAPALLAQAPRRPATVYTIHNLAYQGLFPRETFAALGLPAALWSPDALEFYGQLSFIKGGLAFADRLTTVSPTYAREIQTPALGYGLDGLLRHRAHDLVGILNGIDDRVWDPARDPLLAARYSRRRFAGKRENKLALQQECGLPTSPETPLLSLIGRLVEQKGVDLLLAALPRLMGRGLQLVILGTGQAGYEEALARLARQHAGRMAVRLTYDEGLAHRIEAGADMFLMPSRFEPCGLNQLYSLRYGTVPIVHRVGGLADTVVDADAAALKAGTATGIVFDAPAADALVAAVERALALYRQPEIWRRIAVAGMGQRFNWRASARRYLELYRQLVAAR